MTATVSIKSYRKEREKEIADRLESAMDKVGAYVERKAKENATNPRGGGKHPYVQSGDMSSSIGHITKKEGNKIVSLIGFSKEIPSQKNVWYARIIELGNSRQPPYPFLFPAVEESKPKITEFLKSKGAEFAIE